MKKLFPKFSLISAFLLFSIFFLITETHSAKTFKLLIVDSQQSYPYTGARDAMLQQLATLGFMEGKNLFVKRRSIGNDLKKAENVYREELPRKYDAIFSNGSVSTIAAKNVAFGKAEHRFVFAEVTDPVGIGVIKDFKNQLQANFTGVCYPVPVASRLKFVRDVFPQARTIGLIYADMPQGHSYRKWLETALREEEEFHNLKIIFRKVPLISGDIEGQRKMANIAKKYVLELDPLVDLFLASNDQLSTARPFSEMVFKTATKPLVAVSRDDVMEDWGGAMSIYPSEISSGRQCAVMIKRLFAGEDIKNIIPQWPKENGIAFNLKKTKHFGIKIPIVLLEMASDNILH